MLGLLTVGLVAVCLVVAGRGATRPVEVLRRLNEANLLLVVVVAVAYWAGGRWLNGQSLGAMVAARPAAHGSIGLAVAPGLLVVLVAALTVGLVTPIDDRSGVGGPPGAATASFTSHSGAATDNPLPATTDPPSTSAARARDQAVAVDGLLGVSAASRSSLAAALEQLEGCTGTASAAQVLQQVTAERDSQLARARVLPTDAIVGGDAVRDALVEALAHSVAADRAFAAWAQAVAGGSCTHDLNYRAGQSESEAATVSKRRFCELWNPVASGFGLPVRSEGEV